MQARHCISRHLLAQLDIDRPVQVAKPWQWGCRPTRKSYQTPMALGVGGGGEERILLFEPAILSTQQNHSGMQVETTQENSQSTLN